MVVKRGKTAPLEQELRGPPMYGTTSEVASEYSEESKNYGEPFKFEPDFSGPIKKRSCTDVLCLVLFLAFLGGWGFVAFYGIHYGDVSKVLYPTDSRGDICGKGELQDRPFLLFFDLTRCLNPAVLSLGCPTPQTCVEKCPGTTTSFSLGANSKSQMRPYCFVSPDSEYESKSISELIKDGICPAFVLQSQPLLGRCLPSFSNGGSDNDTIISASTEINILKPITKGTLKHALTALGAFLSVRDYGERIFNDLKDTWWMVGIGLILATILSFVWIILMRFLARIMVWLSIGLSFILVSSLFGYSLYRYMMVKDEVSAQISIFQVNLTPDYLNDVLGLRDTWLAFVCLLGIILAIILLILLALRQRIQIAIELIEQGAKAAGQMYSTMFFPVVPFILHLVVVLWFALVALYLSSAGEKVYTINFDHENIGHLEGVKNQSAPEPPNECLQNDNCINPETHTFYALKDECNPKSFNESCVDCPQITCQFTKYKKSGWFGNWMNWYNIFGFFWAMEFFTAFGEMVLAGVFSKWYWTYHKKDVPAFTLGISLCNALTYHLGTIAFGSLIIGIIRFIRAILQYVENKLKAYNNDLTRCLFCVCKCCLWCLEKFMRFINRNAYIMCAIKSTNFCVSAKDAFSLLMRNIVRVLVLNNVVNFLLLIGKLVIMAGIGVLSYLVFSGGIPELQEEIPNINYMFTPIVVIVIGTYFIASSFFNVYAMAVDTLFLCFLEDLERNDGTPSRPYFMSVGLQKVVGTMQKFNENQPLAPIQQQQQRK